MIADNRLPGLPWTEMATVESGSVRTHPGIGAFSGTAAALDFADEAPLLGRGMAKFRN